LTFFICGLPGGLDYLMLAGVKHKYISKIIEKRYNKLLNVWVRGPGCIASACIIWANWVNNNTSQIPTVVKIVTILLTIANGQYYFSVASALLIKDSGFKVKEVPIRFVNRTRGTSKLNRSEIISSFYFMARTFWHRRIRTLDWKRFLKFCAVGAFGVLVNEGLLWLLTDGFGLFYLYSAMVSIEASIVCNFTLNNIWTFRDRRLASGNIFIRLLKYNLACLIGVGLNVFVLWLLTEILGMHYLISNLFGIAVAVIWNYSASIKWIWMREVKGAAGTHAAHG